MPESVKITDLPAISSADPSDILPIVDASETQTSKITISQIQELGPGENTVSTDTIQDGAVTSAKNGYTGTDLIVYAGTSQTTGGVYKGEETTLTEFGRTLIASPNSTVARQVMNDSPEFFDGLYVGPGEVIADPNDPTDTIVYPGLAFISARGDGLLEDRTFRSTGFFSGVPGEFGFASIGREIMSVRADGSVHLRQFRTPTIADPFNFADSEIVPGRVCVAYASFNSGQADQFISLQSSRKVAEFFGVNGTLAWNQSTGSAATGANQPYGVTWTSAASAGANNHIYNYLVAEGYDGTRIYAQKNDPSFYSFTGIFYNYHSPEDNVHYFVNSSSGTIGGPISAHPKTSNPWIGAMTFYKTNQDVTHDRLHNVREVLKGAAQTTNTNIVSRQFTLDFVKPMPDDKYTVSVSTSVIAHSFVTSKTATSCTVNVSQLNGANSGWQDPSSIDIDISIFR